MIVGANLLKHYRAALYFLLSALSRLYLLTLTLGT